MREWVLATLCARDEHAPCACANVRSSWVRTFSTLQNFSHQSPTAPDGARLTEPDDVVRERPMALAHATRLLHYHTITPLSLQPRARRMPWRACAPVDRPRA